MLLKEDLKKEESSTDAIAIQSVISFHGISRFQDLVRNVNQRLLKRSVKKENKYYVRSVIIKKKSKRNRTNCLFIKK